MLTIPAEARIFVCNVPMNMRKSFEGLSLEIHRIFPGESPTGALFVFLNRRRDHMKILYWDGDGFAIWFKRLEKGSFIREGNASPKLSRRDFPMLLEGVSPRRLQHRFSL